MITFIVWLVLGPILALFALALLAVTVSVLSIIGTMIVGILLAIRSICS